MTRIFPTPEHSESIRAEAAGADLAALERGELAARRRAFLRDWIANRQRGVQLLTGGALLALPLLWVGDTAEAQAAGPVAATAIDGVASAVIGPDGNAQVTLANGQVITIPAAEVTVLADGTLALSAVAAEYVATLAAVATGAATAGVGAAALGAGAAGVAVVGAALAGGGDSGPTVTAVLSTGAPTLNATQVLSAITFEGTAPPGSLVTVTIGGVTKTATADDDGEYTVTFETGEFPAGEGTFDVELKAEEVDDDGMPVGDPLAESTTTITVDLTPPVIAIDDPLPFGDVLNIADSEAQQTITGTVTGNDGVPVTVTLIDSDGDETVLMSVTNPDGTWSATVTPAQMQALAQGTADVRLDAEDAAGNEAAPFFLSFEVDTIAPLIEISDPLAGNNVFTKANEAAGLEVTGTTDAEDGQIVTVTFNGVSYDSGPIAGGVWSVPIPPEAFDGFDTGDEITGITATVSDAAGNPSEVAAGPTIAVDLTGPSITIDPIAGDDIINILESGSNVTISGSVDGAEGQTVTVEIPGTGFSATDTVDGGTWSVSLPQATAAGLDDGDTFTVIAKVEDAEGIEAEAERAFTTAYTSPTVTIQGTRSGDDITDLSTDNVINAAEQNQPLTIFGITTGVADDLDVTVTLPTGATVPATVEGGEWHVTVLPATVQAIVGFAPEGSALVFSATVSDVALNPSLPDSLTVTADLTAPLIEIDPVTGNNELTLANQGGEVIVTGTTDAEPDQEVTVIFDGTPLAVATVTAGGGSLDLPNTWQTSIPQALVDALEDEEGVTEEYLLTAQVNDAAGNPSAVVQATITTDFSAPTVAFAPVTGDDIINAAEASDPLGVTINGTSTGLEEGRQVEVFLDGVSLGTDTVDGSGNFSVTLMPADVPAVDGDYILTAEATNAEGTEAVVTDSTIRVATTLPTITLDEVADGVINIENATDGITISGSTTAEPDQTVTVGFGALTFTADVQSDGSWSVQLTGAEVAGQATHGTPVTVTADVSDVALNPADQVSSDVPVDREAPVVTINPLPFGAFLNDADTGSAQTISGNVADGDGNDVTIEIRDSEGALVFDAVRPVDGSGDWSLDLSAVELGALPEEELSIIVITADDANNPAEASADFTKDVTAPDVAITSVQSGGEDVVGFINIDIRDAGLVVEGTTDDPADVIVTIAAGGFSVDVTATRDGDSWTAVFEGKDGADVLAGLDEGAVTITATSTDAALNEGSDVRADLVADLTPPVINIDTLGDEGVIDRSVDLEVTGTTDAAPGQQVTILFQGVEYTGDVVDGSPGLNTFSIPIPSTALTPLAIGETVALTAQVASLSGNTGMSDPAEFAPYAASLTYITEIGRSGDEIRIAYTLDPRTEIGLDDVVLADQAIFGDQATYLPPFPAPALGPQTQYTTSPAPALQDPPTAADIAAGQPRFLAFWIGDPEGGIPAIFDTSIPLVQFSLELADPDEVFVLDSTFSPGGGVTPVRQQAIIGTDGDDDLVAPNVDATIRGRGGDDTIDVSAGGVNTVIFEADPADNGVDEVIGFSVAPDTALPDRIGFAGLTNSDLRGDGTAFEALAVTDALGTNTGFVVLTTDLPGGGVTAGNIATAAAGLTGEEAGDVIYMLATDGTDAALARVTYTDVDDASAVIMANFTGLGDLSGITADEILGFNPVV